MDIDDDVLQDGFSDLLNMAYRGDLSLDEYVLLIENSCWSKNTILSYHYPSIGRRFSWVLKVVLIR